MYTFDPERLEKVHALEADGVRTYPSASPVSHTSLAVRTAAEGQPDDALVGLGRFVLAGRLLFKNEMGKAGFGRLLDRDGRVQVYVKKDEVGEPAFALWKKLDLGDIVHVEGTLMRTRTGELTVKAESIRLLTKCIASLPDKFHGIADPELRQRQRYLDLFMNDETRETFQRRSRIVRYIRNFFEARDYLEVETPMMHPIPGGATARPFVTHHNALDTELFLRIAPELYLKRLVVGGFERVFEINRNFRNEGIDSTHNPEFTMLEWYQAHATWRDLVDMTEEMLAGCAQAVCGTTEITYQGQAISLAAPFRRVGYDDLVAEATGLSMAEIRDPSTLRAWWIERHGDDGKVPRTIGRLWEAVFDEHVEKGLIQPTFVTRFPIEISPLARRNDQEPDIADRFELFIAGREISNGFTELNDPVDQAGRFEAQVKSRTAGDQEAMHFDEDYVRALTFGLPPTAGEGLGIDRLVMLLTDSASIRDVILFPTLRPRA
ncbi:MAG: lysine--tRNA ligase [Pseudomonadota bacterium]|nr:lysine--tRNA ligase [Pseudomonadota bacterium]